MENTEIKSEIPIDTPPLSRKEKLIKDFGLLPYNYFLYDKRLELKKTKREFAKDLKISIFRYRLIESGYIKPNKKEINKISTYFNIDYSIYLEGLASYPIETVMEEDHLNKKLIPSKPFKIVMISILLISFIAYIASRIYSSNVNSIIRSELNEPYIEFIDGISNSEEFTFTISGPFTRPMIYKRNGVEYTSIIGEYGDNPFGLDFNYTIFETDYRITYKSTMKTMTDRSIHLMITYVDYITYEEKLGDAYYRINEGYTLEHLIDTGTGYYEDDPTVVERINTHIQNYKNRLEELILDSLNLSLNIDKDILSTAIPIQDKTTPYGYISMLIYIISLIHIVISSILLTYSFIYGKNKYSMNLLSESDFEEKILDYYSMKKEVKKDIRIGPMVPEWVYQIVGGIFTVASIVISLIYFVFNIIGKTEVFSEVGLNSVFSLLVAGIFMMLFVDFDIYLNDRRVIRNIFIYIIIFFFIYNIQVLVINYLSKISIGLMAIEKFNIRLPNYFGSIALYFMILLFLFTTPKWANTKKKLVIYRLFSILPIVILITTTIISIGYKSFGWYIPTNMLYLIDTAKPQISFLVVTYLISIYFLRIYYKSKYDVKNANRFFNGNRYLILKNLIALAITVLISLIELSLMHNSMAKEFGFGLYPTFFLLGIILLFHRPHLGKRKKATMRATIVLNTITFSTLYILIAIAIAIALFILLI